MINNNTLKEIDQNVPNIKEEDMSSIYSVLWAPHNQAVTLKLLRYTIVMFTFPVGVFYLFYYKVCGGDKKYLGWAGIAAVVAANVVVAFYVRMAYTEDSNSVSTNSDNEGRVATAATISKKTD